MPAYITITDPETDPEAPLTSELAKKWRDNPLAIAEGAIGAITDKATIRIGALQRLAAGASTRLSRTVSRSVSSGSLTVVSTLGFLQAGTIRANVSNTGTLVSRTNQITRVRAGTTTTIVSSTASTINTDIDVLPGDLFDFSSAGSWTSGTQNIFSTVVLSTNGEDLFPGEGMFGYITGNTIN